ncbi:probable aquaporin NIP7-1 [Diospyros lotus]|uniref:probable aquaporin NIP7-1 n=1 Tax=Diospyros lotus TaxID=55363 RepID=UPI0022570115|nr:probable aquaporin NIP7-1 [Diospyros lotus]
MKHLIEAQPFPDNISIEASTSSQSKYDQEIGSLATSRISDAPMKNSILCFRAGMDHDLLRKVTYCGTNQVNSICDFIFCKILYCSYHAEELFHQLLAEALGTFILVFSIGGIVAVTQLMGGGPVGLLEYAATAALSVVVIVFSIGAISGAHVNPAVTIAFAACGQFPWPKVPLYLLAQVIGSVMAAYGGKLVYGLKTETMMTRPLHGVGAAFGVELIATFILMFLASSLAWQAKYVCHVAGFVIGIAIGLAVLITGPVSGGSLNPARSLGPAIVSWKFDGVWIYLIAPTAGAVAGAFLFHALRLQRHPCCAISAPDVALLRPGIDQL